jgi:hypothetical protein
MKSKRDDICEELTQLLRATLLPGAVLNRKIRCGKKTCRCFKDPSYRHPVTALSISKGFKQTPLRSRIREEDLQRVQDAVSRRRRILELVEVLAYLDLEEQQEEKEKQQ